MIERFGKIREVEDADRIVQHVSTATTSALANSRSSRTSTRRSSIQAFDAGSSSISSATSASRPTRSRWRAHGQYFRIPRNVLTICLGKSTYARCNIIVNVTPLEPEWEACARVLEHDAAAREDLRQRRRGAGDLLRVGRGMRNVVQGSRWQVSGAAGGNSPQDLIVAATESCQVRWSDVQPRWTVSGRFVRDGGWRAR
jgi:hypothetical protein